MKQKLFTILLCLFVTVVTSTGTARAFVGLEIVQGVVSIIEYLQKAETFIDNIQYKEAVEQCNQYISIKNDDANAYFIRANAYYEDGQLRAAIDDYNMALALDPNNPDIYAARGNANYMLGRYNEANADFNSTLNLDPNNFWGLMGKTDIENIGTDTFPHTDGYKKVLSMYPDNEYVYYKMGEAYKHVADNHHQENYWKIAVDYYSMAISLNSRFHKAYLSQGDCYLKLNDYNSALNSYNRATLIAPQNPISHHKVGYVYYRFGNYDEALRYYNKSVELNPEYPDVYKDRAELYRKMGQPAFATRDESRYNYLRNNNI